jgi:hypothetical protein
MGRRPQCIPRTVVTATDAARTLSGQKRTHAPQQKISFDHLVGAREQ